MKNFLLDGILIALFVAELNFQNLPKVLHEIFGVAFTAAVVIHLWSNRRRLVAPAKKITPRKFFGVTIDFAPTICVAVIATSGVCMSNYLFAEAASFELRRNMTIHQLHVALPYVAMILIGVHVGLHWRELRQKLFRRHEKIFLALFGVSAIIGTAGLSLNRVGDRILMKHIVATPATEFPAALFALMIVGGVILFALITVLLDKKFSGA